jgi:YgiT-type zinc finger domain-containing protein
MKCLICKYGETVKETTTITLDSQKSTIVFKEVPAEICNNCGEKYIDDNVTKELLLKAREIAKNGVEVDIRKFKKVA